MVFSDIRICESGTENCSAIEPQLIPTLRKKNNKIIKDKALPEKNEQEILVILPWSISESTLFVAIWEHKQKRLV